MIGLMYPAYQKYYSALCNLKRFSIENNFFENISSLDNFFSEYRSVTLVMQKSLAHTQYEEIYKKETEGKWDKFFNDQRVKSIHIHPVEFVKKIDINMYSPKMGFEISSKSFSIENDIPFANYIDSIKETFIQFNPIEVFFSAKFSFIEKDSKSDIWDKVVDGLTTMEKFMDKMYDIINEDCPLCKKLRDEIRKLNMFTEMKDMFLVTDYVYYPSEDIFERGDKVATNFGYNSSSRNKQSIYKFNSLPGLKKINSTFMQFVCINTFIGKTDLMPTIMTVYKDDTFDIDTFHSSIKTTFYRKINEVADIVKGGDVKEVFVMMTYVFVDYDDTIMHLTSKERLLKGAKEYLVFMKVDFNLNEEEFVFDDNILNNREYIFKNLVNIRTKKLNIGVTNMMPIVQAFRTLKNKDK